MSYSYDYTLGESIVGESAGSIGTINAPKAGLFDPLLSLKGSVKPKPESPKSSPSLSDKIFSAAGKGIDIASSYARKQELVAEAAAKRAEAQRINAAGSNIQKYILPIAVGGAALIGIIYFARKK